MVAGADSSSGGTSPLTARSLRLERVAQALAYSQEELRRYMAKIIKLSHSKYYFLVHVIPVIILGSHVIIMLLL